MPAAQVIRNLIDNSSYTPASAGVSAALVLDAVRGPSEPVLVTTQREFLDLFTANGELTRSIPVGYYSALEYLSKSNQLYVRRVNGAGVLGAIGGGIDTDTAEAVDQTDLDSAANQALRSGSTFLVQSDQKYDTDMVTQLDAVSKVVSVWAKDGGSWANGYSVALAASPLGPDEDSPAYTLTVSNGAGVVQESFLMAFEADAKDNFGNGIFYADVIRNSDIVVLTASAPTDWDEVAEGSTLEDAADLANADAIVLSGGTDQTAPVQAVDAIAALEDFEGLDIRLWLNGGYTDVAFQKALVGLAERDFKSFAILTVPYTVAQTGDPVAIVDWNKNTLNVNSTQATAPFDNWLEIAAPGGTRYVSPDGYVGGNLSRIMTNQNFWTIVAGEQNGRITTPISVLNRWSQGQLNTLADGGVNPIASFPGQGIVLWGQRTATQFPSGLDRMNVSLLIMFITIAAERFLRTFLFRPNTDQTLDEIEAGLIQFGDSIKANNGVYAYRIEIESTDFDKDNYRATVNFYVEPVKGIEQIILNEIVVNTGELG